MDAITHGYLKEFIDKFDLEDDNNKISDNFEYFCSYVILSKLIKNQSLELSDLEAVSAGKNKGIDSICFIINGKLISTFQELNDIFDINGEVRIDIIFIQSKSSSSFSDSELGNMSDVIKDFLFEVPLYEMTDTTRKYHSFLDHIKSNFSKVKAFNSKAYYCCTGIWNEDTSINTTLQIKNNELNNQFIDYYNNKGKYSLTPLGKNELQKLFDKTKSSIDVEINFRNKVCLENPPTGVSNAYIGMLEFPEFKKIIIDNDTNSIRNLFYDNVRDNLGNNIVNSRISKTLEDKKYLLFPLLNNGVTIISEEIHGIGNKMTLKNFQIVNGCQTSNVIFSHISDEGINELIIPIKIIISQDEDVRDEIILATNQQTEIKEEQLFALTNFQKKLEQFFITQGNEIFYERRVNQYQSTNIKKKNIVDLREMIKSYVAIYKEEPHIVSGYFGKTFSDHKDDIFKDDHYLEPYYFAAFLQYKFKDLLNKKIIDRKYNKYRYHVFMLFRKIFESEEFKINLLSNKKIVRYTNDLFDQLKDENVVSNFNKAFSILDSSGVNIDSQDEVYKKSTTNAFLEKFKEVYK